jgi:hypothetical protein
MFLLDFNRRFINRATPPAVPPTPAARPSAAAAATPTAAPRAVSRKPSRPQPLAPRGAALLTSAERVERAWAVALGLADESGLAAEDAGAAAAVNYRAASTSPVDAEADARARAQLLEAARRVFSSSPTEAVVHVVSDGGGDDFSFVDCDAKGAFVPARTPFSSTAGCRRSRAKIQRPSH